MGMAWAWHGMARPDVHGIVRKGRTRQGKARQGKGIDNMETGQENKQGQPIRTYLCARASVQIYSLWYAVSPS